VTRTPAKKRNFVGLNAQLTAEVVRRLGRAGRHGAVIAEAPPGAGKSTLTASVAKGLVDQDPKLRLAIVTQTNEQADDLLGSIARRYRGLRVARLCGGDGASSAVKALLGSSVTTGTKGDEPDVQSARIVVSTARKWQYERSRVQASKGRNKAAFPFALIDEAYQMRSDLLLGIADLFDTLFCVGDPGQLDPFTVIDDSIWKGLPYSPSRAALATLRQFHQELDPLLLPTSWRLPPSAAGIVSSAFYPFTGFEAGTSAGDRMLELGRARSRRGTAQRLVDADVALATAATSGWAFIELSESFTLRTDVEIATTLATLVERLLARGATVVDELHRDGAPLSADRVAVIAAHNDQVHAVRWALDQRRIDPDSVVVSTANKIQGREYDVVLVWHPLAGRRDATAFHLEAGRMCVMLSRHRHACIVVGRAGATRLLEEFPDSDPVFLDEPEKFPDGWQANHEVLEHLARFRVG
jgi:hypothetical protein